MKSRQRTRSGRFFLWTMLCVGIVLPSGDVSAQPPNMRIGEVVPRDVRELYDRGLKYLASTQSERGDWPNSGGEVGPGPTGMALMVFLASGEDPNFGVYSGQIRKALRSLISAQDPGTGYLGSSMYHHGFGMLALAEAYGTVDDQLLWPENTGKRQRSIGAALELAVRAAITAQKRNPFGAWRYSPTSNDADTSVSGAVLVGLLAARNAGIEVPDSSIDQAINYFKSMTSNTGQVAYSGIGGFDHSHARISIASLVYSVARRKDIPQYKATVEFLKQHLEEVNTGGYLEYTQYYEAQALFQGDLQAWEKWNRLLLNDLKARQKPDGSIQGQFGGCVGTSMSLLALALNYRFLPIYER